jgi:HSP20 family protein
MTLTPFSARQRRGGGQLAGAPGYRSDPRREMDDINSRFSQLIQSFFGDSPMFTGASGWSPLAPPVDIEETEDAYRVDVDLPNVNPEDVSIEMRGEELRISGMFEPRDRAGVMRHQNRQTGDFEYLVDLPSDIDGNRVEATYENGVLTVTVGKAQDAQSRRIEIRTSQPQQQVGQRDGQQTGQRDSQRDGQQTSARDGQQANARDGQQATTRDAQGAGKQGAQGNAQRA